MFSANFRGICLDYDISCMLLSNVGLRMAARAKGSSYGGQECGINKRHCNLEFILSKWKFDLNLYWNKGQGGINNI